MKCHNRDPCLENPLLNTLTKYTDAYNVKYAEKQTTVIETLTRTFGDESVAKMFLAGKEEATTKNIATKFETDQLEMWLSSGKSVDNLLNLPLRRYLLIDFVGKPLFNTWLAYMNTVMTKNPDKTSALKILFPAVPCSNLGCVIIRGGSDKESWFFPLRAKYHDDGLEKIIDKAIKDPSTIKIAKLVEKERMNEWLENWKHTPDYAFRFLHLNNAGESLFSSPKFELWVKYLDNFNQAYPSKKTTMIDSIRANFIDLDLLPILAAAKKVQSTEKLASQLQDALVNKWLGEKVTVWHTRTI